jgi:hypothetical protein
MTEDMEVVEHVELSKLDLMRNMEGNVNEDFSNRLAKL